MFQWYLESLAGQADRCTINMRQDGQEATMSKTIQAKRVYEPYDEADGTRVLVERLWPRGFTHERLHADTWMRDIAPTADLRKWYAHDVAKWPEFAKRYRVELGGHLDLVEQLLAISRKGNLTLLFATSDTEHSGAMVLLNNLKEHTRAT
jgi:uncharacterized protein YeaO (DUF488 family)